MTSAALDPRPLRRALATEPEKATTWQRLGLICAAGGDVAAALTPLRRAVTAAPGLAAPWETLGIAFAALGRWPEAASAFETALERGSARADLAARLADALGRAGRMADAARALDRAIGLAPTDPRLRYDRGMARAMGGDAGGALADLGAALAAEPGSTPVHYALAQCALRLDRQDAAERGYRRVRALDGSAIDAVVNLGVVLQARHDAVGAARQFRHAIALSPANGTAQGNLGVLDMGLGRIEAAVRWLRRSVDTAPDWVEAHSNLLLALGYTEMDRDRYFDEHRRWEGRHAAAAYAFHRPFANDPDPDRRLKVGYLSADFFDHALGTNISGLVAHHDRRAVEVRCYAEIGRPDDMTRHIRELADAFVETQRMDDRELAERIRSDGVDILVVLAGHTARNRLLAAARKPAPILVSYADFSTTGLAAMDYWLTDPIVHPEGQTGERFTETLMRVPMMVLHRPIDVAPPVTTLPARERGHVTFGSCNNPAKIGAGVLDLWAAILSQVPRSRLALKYRKVYEVPDVRARIRGRFAERGVDPDRVVFIGGDVDRASHLALVGEMDVALDPFPFNGCTTTFEALWMGVPVVTLAGRRFLGRMGTSFLTHLGMPELVAPTPEAYVGTAVALSADLDRLAAIRSGLRDRVMASPLCDGPAYARSIEAAFRGAWRRWCESRR